MIDAALIAQIEGLPIHKAMRVGDAAFTAHDRAVIEAAYVSLFDKELRECSCRHILTDAALEIMAAFKIKSTMKRNYIMKAGALIWVDGNPYSNANITDKIAKKWCKAHPMEVVDYFQEYPVLESKEDDNKTD